MHAGSFWTLVAICLPLTACGACGSGGGVGSGPSSGGAILVLHNARIHTVNEAQPWAEALVAEDGEIVFVGGSVEALSYAARDARVVDAGGRLVLPGFHDTHQHTLEAHLPIIDCSLDGDEVDPEAYIDVVARCRPAGETGWVLGHGHSVLTLFEATRPPREILDDALPDVPVVILEATSHSSWVNTRALEVLGIDADTPDPPGGVIGRDEQGEPNGVLVDAAGEWPWDTALAPSASLDALNYAALLDGQAHNSEMGITTAVDARVYWQRGYLTAYARAEREDALTVRMVLSLWATPLADDDEQIAALSGMYRDDGGLLRISQVKVYDDGLLENTTAALREPYATTDTFAGPLGLNYFDEARLTRYLRDLQAVGFDLHIHAIGDRAIHEALNAVEATRADPGGRNARHRLTHVELVSTMDLARFAPLGVHADMQPGEHSRDEGLHEVEPFVGDRTAQMWRLRDFLDAGVNLALSSDYDVGELSPFVGIENALSLGSRAPASVAEAVRMYTLNGAQITRSEAFSGSLEPGKVADFVVLDRDIFAIPVSGISETKVLWTVLEGDEVYRAPGFAP